MLSGGPTMSWKLPQANIWHVLTVLSYWLTCAPCHLIQNINLTVCLLHFLFWFVSYFECLGTCKGTPKKYHHCHQRCLPQINFIYVILLILGELNFICMYPMYVHMYERMYLFHDKITFVCE